MSERKMTREEVLGFFDGWIAAGEGLDCRNERLEQARAAVSELYDTTETLRAEVERLRGELAQERQMHDTMEAKSQEEILNLKDELAEAKRDAATSGNYIADSEIEPREVTFANGRVVRVVGEGYLEVIREF